MPRTPSWFAVFGLLAACGPLGPVRVDGGGATGGGFVLGGGAATGGGATTGGGVATGGGTATGGGGGAATGGGSSTGGGGESQLDGGAPLRWSSMVLPTSSSTPIVAISGQVGDVWALQYSSQLYRSTGGAFTAVVALPSQGAGLHAWNGTVTVATAFELWTCTSDCTVRANYVRFALPNGVTVGALCGRGTKVTVIAAPANGRAQRWDQTGTQWTMSIGDLGTTGAESCWFDQNDTLWVGSVNRVTQVTASGSISHAVLGNAGLLYGGGAAVAGENFVAGVDTFARFSAGSWVRSPEVTGEMTVVAALSSTSAYVVGRGGVAYWWNGLAAHRMNDLEAFVQPTSRISSATVIGGEAWIGGATTVGFVLRGTP